MNPTSILFVDDEPLLRETIGNDLKSQGYEVGTASSGAEAMTKLIDHPYDLVITDLIMEEMSGIQLLRKINDTTPETMVMVMTGYGSLQTAIEAIQLGAVDYLLKPCDRGELAFRVLNCFEKKSLQGKVKLYEGILPLCGYCRKVARDDTTDGQWVPIDEFLVRKVGVRVSHGICPDCYDTEIQAQEE